MKLKSIVPLILEECKRYNITAPNEIIEIDKINTLEIGYVQKWKKDGKWRWTFTYNRELAIRYGFHEFLHFVLHEIGHIRNWDAKRSEWVAERFANRELAARYPKEAKILKMKMTNRLYQIKIHNGVKKLGIYKEILPLYGFK